MRFVLIMLCVIGDTAACDSGTSTSCLSAKCGASALGTWEFVDCAPPQDLTYTETRVSNGQSTEHTCRIALGDNDLVDSSRLSILGEGTFSKTSSFSGQWSGIADTACMEEFALTCEHLPDLDFFGITSCTQLANGCSCQGRIDRTSEESGTWVSGNGEITLAGRDFSRTYSLCADETAMILDAGGIDVLHYRKLGPTSPP